mmetsp:Transcript_20254/g.49689  ORF Transcript_20254/g.49689 Transcript_20254/m.49689 type:complete len:271 (+) Transcript_20254:1150-1962(+)
MARPEAVPKRALHFRAGLVRVSAYVTLQLLAIPPNLLNSHHAVSQRLVLEIRLWGVVHTLYMRKLELLPDEFLHCERRVSLEAHPAIYSLVQLPRPRVVRPTDVAEPIAFRKFVDAIAALMDRHLAAVADDQLVVVAVGVEVVKRVGTQAHSASLVLILFPAIRGGGGGGGFRLCHRISPRLLHTRFACARLSACRNLLRGSSSGGLLGLPRPQGFFWSAEHGPAECLRAALPVPFAGGLALAGFVTRRRVVTVAAAPHMSLLKRTGSRI